MKEYMDYVNEEHLPRIDVQKQIEIENRKNNLLNRPKQRIANPKRYSTDSYKNEVSKSIDWSSYKNPLIPPPKKERPGFVKIDYLRF